MSKPTDKFGFPLKIGDEVLYAGQGANQGCLMQGHITAVTQAVGSVKVNGQWRVHTNVMSLETLKETHSSLFV